MVRAGSILSVVLFLDCASCHITRITNSHNRCVRHRSWRKDVVLRRMGLVRLAASISIGAFGRNTAGPLTFANKSLG